MRLPLHLFLHSPPFSHASHIATGSLMKAVSLQRCCRAAAAFPRKRPRLAFYGEGFNNPVPASPVPLRKAFSSSSSHTIKGNYGNNDTVDPDEEFERARLQLEEVDLNEDFKAAPPIDFDAQDSNPAKSRPKDEEILKKLRVLPQSPAYFSGRPRFTDDYVSLNELLRKNVHLPTISVTEAARLSWVSFQTYSQTVGEGISQSRYNRMIEILKRLSLVHPKVRSKELQETLEKWTTASEPYINIPNPIEVDEDGVAGAVGRRKASKAKAWVVEGEGEILINGMPLHQAFARVHDRESVIWALKSTQRVDKYNVFAIVHGGGTTGQAEALTLAISKALMAHEPMLKNFLRRVGCVARDPRRVERKKPGRLKARKKPTWVKR